MLVTDKEYSMEKAFVGKLDLIVERKLNKTDDAVLIIDGDEGQGKTEFACGMCYYIASKTGRPYTIENIFFDLDEGMKFAASTKEQIIHLDEGVLGLLTTQWQSKTQQKFLQLVMTARKKKHFIVICIPKFHRLPQYVIEERAIGLIHIYSRKNLEKGRFLYFKKKSKNILYQDWKSKKKKTYKKHYDIRGTFSQCMEKIFTDEEIEEYERKKDGAILSITDESGKSKNNNRYTKITSQRDKLISMINTLFKQKYKLTSTEVKKLLENYEINMAASQIREVTIANPIKNIEIPLKT